MNEGIKKEPNLFCIKDTKAGFWKPFVSPNENCAVREFSALVNDSNNPNVRTVARDLELYRLGTFSDANGSIESDVQFVVSAIGLIKEIDNG